MKTTKILWLANFFLVIMLSITAFAAMYKTPVKKITDPSLGKGFAVVELFTSEGCSSCPPADELMAKLEKESVNKELFVLAYHVDYFDRLGWKDAFGSPEYSKRQVQYGQWLRLPQIYTPQVIVSGSSEFIGSEEASIRKAISKQLATKATAEIKLQSHLSENSFKVHYQASVGLRGSNLLIAIVQKAAHTNVARGENEGRTLSHVQIVRKLQYEKLNNTGNGAVSVTLPKGYNEKDWEVIGLIQNQNSGQIIAAAKATKFEGTADQNQH
ncbi:DUF1223 domain-containing protein [Pedobacter sp. UBA5917]|jgi:hypothetical protein|uniref:DUF1223 domain-containing protein n=1 Tax=Pedobacter sp. UBA5917 TaxID=1947061 RepID=UPI0025E890AD|nr:DUF1223 domain-containing protein [Pedobacter sp. UBA5917]